MQSNEIKKKNIYIFVCCNGYCDVAETSFDWSKSYQNSSASIWKPFSMSTRFGPPPQWTKLQTFCTLNQVLLKAASLAAFSKCFNCNGWCLSWLQNLVGEFLPSSIIDCLAIMCSAQLLHKTMSFINCWVLIDLCWKKAARQACHVHRYLSPDIW